MAKATKTAAKKVAKKVADKSESLVKKISEVQKMTDEEKQAFREAGGTTIEG